MENHTFTNIILEVLKSSFPDDYIEIFKNNELIKYINIKTRSASKESKSRGSFANLYAIYVLLEDYLMNNFDKNSLYSSYEGAIFTNLLKRQRELPFGEKLQNHALNHRLNEEFKKYFPTCDYIPILRDPETNRYWFNENLIKFSLNKKNFNIANIIIKIIDRYIITKQKSLQDFMQMCILISENKNIKEAENFIIKLLEPYTDARLFEIVSFSILKYYYSLKSVFIGFSIDNISEEKL